MTLEQIKALVNRLPELDVQPPEPPPPPQPKPDPSAKPDPKDPKATKPDPKAQPTNPKKPQGPPVKGKLTGPAWPQAQMIYDEVLAGGPEAVAMVVDLIKLPELGSDYKPRYLLNGLATYVCRKGKESQRAVVNQGIAARLAKVQPKLLQGHLIRILQVSGDASVVPALAPFLSDAELCAPATQALVAIGGAGEPLRAALGSASGPCRLAIVQALGGLKDATATDALLRAAGDADENVRLAALWALARAGAPQAVGPVCKAAAAGEGWALNQATRAALLLGETLAANGNAAEARKVYTFLVENRPDAKDAHVRHAAQAGLDHLK